MRLFNKLIEYLYLKMPNNKVYWDSLTGCRTYTYYKDVITKKYENKEVLIIYVDCNCLKSFNDDYGHNRGNDLIYNIGADLKSLSNTYDICRMGGDEFLVIASIYFDTSLLKSWKYSYISDFCATGLYIKSKNESVDNAVNIADKLMYENKCKIKGKRYFSSNNIKKTST